MQECPYKNNKLERLPCAYRQHPEREEVFFCQNCGNWYNVREIGGESTKGFWLIVALILFLLLIASGNFEKRNFPSPNNATIDKIEDRE